MADGEGKGNKLFLYLGLGLVVIIVEVAISFFVVNKMFNPAGGSAVSAAVVDSNGVAVVDTTGENGEEQPFQLLGKYTLADFVINPAQSQGKHFFVTTIVFGFNSPDLEEKMTAREPILQDRLISSLSKRTFNWFQMQENKEILKDELREMALDILEIDSGVEIFFTRYVLQ